MKYSKITLFVATIVLEFNWCFSLQCFTCRDCENGSPVEKQSCVSNDLSCGKVEFTVNLPSAQYRQVIKGCMPKLSGGNCKLDILDLLQRPGSEVEQSVFSWFQTYRPDIKCSFCSEDYCNDSQRITSSALLTTFVLALVIKFVL